MAARKNTAHLQKTRDKIRTTQLLNRLQDHVVGKVEMTSSQIRAAEILLNKTLPNLQAQTIDVDVDGELVIRWEK